MKLQQRPVWFKGGETAEWVTRFTVGNDHLWDTMLLPYDIVATRAHARGLLSIGVLDSGEHDAVELSLAGLADRVAAGEVIVKREDEDCHTVIERALTMELGDVGRKIHTGRSRNDQVLAALRLFLRDSLGAAAGLTADIVERLCILADAHGGDVMPGYTHMQRAMPTTAGLWAAGYAELLTEDTSSILDARRRINISPLGSAAGYGVPFLRLPREDIARDAGFDGIQRNVTSVQLSRGKLEMQVVHACVQVCATLNRLASDLVLFNTSEFGFVELPDEFCTGSSIMPQKKNPDVLELVRANYHRLVAELHLLATLPANLPSGYHRDLQLTKESVMRAVTATIDVLTAVENVLPGVAFRVERMRAACSPELFATADAIKLVLEGVPFREAYRQVATSTSGLSISGDDILGAYVSAGYPGRAAVDPIRTRVRQLVSSLDEKGA